MTRPAGPREYFRRKRRSLRKNAPRRFPGDAAVVSMKARFLVLYGATGVIRSTCAALQWPDGLPLKSAQVDTWRERDPVFRGAMLEAKLRFAESLESEAHRRAVIGVKKDVYYKGDVVGEVTEYSDQLLTTLLKANMPDKYRERVDVNLDVAAQIALMAEQFGVSREEAEAEWETLQGSLQRPRLVGGGG